MNHQLEICPLVNQCAEGGLQGFRTKTVSRCRGPHQQIVRSLRAALPLPWQGMVEPPLHLRMTGFAGTLLTGNSRNNAGPQVVSLLVAKLPASNSLKHPDQILLLDIPELPTKPIGEPGNMWSSPR